MSRFQNRLQEALDNIWVDNNMQPREKYRDEIGFTDSFHGFDKKSLAAYTSAKFLSELSNKLSRMTKYSMNLFICDEFPDHNDSVAWLSRKSGVPMEKMSKSINFLLGGEGGLLRVSPWLILHQFGEAIIVYEDLGTEFREIADYARAYFPKTWYIDLFKMGSAREARAAGLNAPEDGIQELIVEYMWHGCRIRYNIPEGYDERKVRIFIRLISHCIERILDRYVGKVISAGFQ